LPRNEPQHFLPRKLLIAGFRYWPAVETETTEIMTVDVADFTRYRLPDNSFFTIL